MPDSSEWYLNIAMEAERLRQLAAAEQAFQTTVTSGGNVATAQATKVAAVAAAHAAVSTVAAKVAAAKTPQIKGK